MNTSARGTVRVFVLPVVLAALAAACSSSSTPAPSNAPVPTVAAPSIDLGGGSISIPSLALPSLPNQATDLEAMLPSTFCGKPVTKASVAGAAVFAGSTDPTFAAALQAIGKTPADVSVAFGTVVADPTCDTTFAAFQIKGVDQGQFQQVYEAASTHQGDTVSHVNLGGKDVVKDVSSSGGSTTYVYFKGDVALAVMAKSDADAAKGLAAMP
jgi:hypothetical protein